MNRSDRLDRTLLAAVGTVLLAGGTYALARSYAAFGHAQAHDPVLLENVRTFVGRHQDWFWPVAFVAALIAAYLGYHLTRTQLITGPPEQEIHHPHGADDLTIAPSVVAHAIAKDLNHESTITRARARLTHLDDAPELHLELTVADNTPVAQLRRHIEEQTLPRARNAIDSPPITAHVTITLADPAPRQLN